MKSESKKVTIVGWQECVNGEWILLVNDCKSHTTVAYDILKHTLVKERV